MKHILLLIFTLYSGIALSASITITNSGFTFSPSNISINVGDIIKFELGTSHNAVEVSEETWNSNGTAVLPGFSTPFGGGEISGLTAGVHYYVCTNHASMGMKGKITVNEVLNLSSVEKNSNLITIYPNPSKGYFFIKTSIDKSVDTPFEIYIYNSIGSLIFTNRFSNFEEFEHLDLTNNPDGIYFIKIINEYKIYEKEILKL